MDVYPRIIIVDTQIGFRRVDGQVVDMLNVSLATPSLWHSTDVLQVYLTAKVARCVNLLMYDVNQNDSTKGRKHTCFFVSCPTQAVL